MSFTYRMFAPNESPAMLADPGCHIPQTSLGSFRDIRLWFESHTCGWRRREVDEFVFDAGDGYFVIELITVRQREVLSSEVEDGAAKAYVPREDEAVVEIEATGRGEADDQGLLAECAMYFGASVLDCQAGNLIVPEEWRRSAIADGT